MRSLFGLVGLLLTLAMVGMLAKNQLSGSGVRAPALQVPASGGSGPDTPGAAPQKPVTAGEQQQIQQQYKQAMEAAMQPRELPAEAK